MPEVNEVKAIARALASKLNSLYIDTHTISGGPAGIHSRQKIIKISSKGKLIYFQLESAAILSTLGLTGEWIISLTPPEKVNKGFKPRLRKVLSLFSSTRAKKPIMWLYYMDPLNFGKIKLVSMEQLDKKLESLGIDATKITERQFSDIINDGIKSSAGVTISKFLLSQKWISGVGVYILSEMLYHARVAPMRALRAISPGDIKRLYAGLRWCLDNFIVKMKLLQDLTLAPSEIDTWDVINYPFKIYDLKATSGSTKSKNTILRYEVEPGRFVKYSPNRQK